MVAAWLTAFLLFHVQVMSPVATPTTIIPTAPGSGDVIQPYMTMRDSRGREIEDPKLRAAIEESIRSGERRYDRSAR